MAQLARFPAAEVRNCTHIYDQMSDAIWIEAGRSAALHCLSVLNPWREWQRRDLPGARLALGRRRERAWGRAWGAAIGTVQHLLRGKPTHLRSGFFYVLFFGSCWQGDSVDSPGDREEATKLIPEKFHPACVFDRCAM
eukprot:gene14415-18848_t